MDSGLYGSLFGTIAEELILEILFFLTTKELCRTCSVSKAWKKYAEDESIWKRKCLETERLEVSKLSMKHQKYQTWKGVFKKISECHNLFPLYGVILERTTRPEIENLGGKSSDKQSSYYVLNEVNFWFHNRDVIWSMYIARGIYKIPEPWEKMGITWHLSYNNYKKLLLKLFGNCTVTTAPHSEMFSGQNCFTARLYTESKEHGIIVKLALAFSYSVGNEDSSDTLYSLTISSSLN
eukprot:TRINITY_DN10889_c0_g1_i2.p1 TRINITY_DN10889_c0_g1~~TRINITY_DN10889_c0_g1_i2.p1  ORF type:complete len:237 (-),score=23.93 TRINITY_DN10889_c0_g1_i2:62-772(-)